MSRTHLAAGLGVEPNSVARIERGEVFPGDRLERIASLLSVGVADLFVDATSDRRSRLLALAEHIEQQRPELVDTAAKLLRALLT